MKAAVTLEAATREVSNKGAARELRRNGRIPAVVYSKGGSNVTISLDENTVTQEYLRGGFFSKIVEVKMGKDTLYALPKDVQMHPVSDKIEHVDLYQVTDKSTIKAQVPVHFLNMERSIGLKRGGTLNIVRHELELICGVNNIPRYIEIDLKDVNIGDSVHISHVTLPEGVTPAIKDRDFTIATVAGRGGKQEEEEAAPAAAAAAATPAKAAPAKAPAKKA